VTLLRSRGNLDLSDKPVPNPVVWAGGVDVYSRFVAQWLPGKRGDVPTGDITKMKREGSDLLNSERSLLGSLEKAE
jgi:hypothetical protein